ncbi:hypothetical protein [Qiania dongpingensis]|uniref:Uncharacterized protein n=1 Tax=Qiania dongpingensis TaxID=2763669 RepID=A0A7G9G6B5_9FIRM|nr:hypothetical protein [Qiania dongpingensis]QNM06347.1 hypothetical protein H9Q78_04210 [Qiania dongpingensis]
MGIYFLIRVGMVAAAAVTAGIAGCVVKLVSAHRHSGNVGMSAKKNFPVGTAV